MTRLRWLSLVLVTAGACSSPPVKQSLPPARPAPAPAPRSVQPDEAWRARKPNPGNPGELHYPAAEVAELGNKTKLYFVRRPGGMPTMAGITRRKKSSMVCR